MIIPTVEISSNNSAILIFKASACNDLHNCRTIWNIIWSSVFTLFACVWLSVHPNIPAPDESWGSRVIRRVWTMIAVLFVPEVLVGWAMRQWVLASKAAKDNKKYGWTRTHGFFVLMGGFMECDKDGQPIRTFTIENVDTIPVKTKWRTLKEDITARSKGDTLSKAFAILQTTWFILQCISRSVEGLPVTELEIATAAFCVLNFVTYVVWWDKPLNVSSPVRVYPEGETTKDGEEEAEVGKEGVEKGEEGLIDKCRSTWKEFKQGLVDIPKEIYRPVAALVKREGLLRSIVLFPPFVINIILRGETFETNGKRVGTFGPMAEKTSADLITSIAVGTVFGAIHLTAWTSQFPTFTEQLLWRVAAISVTTVPLLLIVFGLNKPENIKTPVLKFLFYLFAIPTVGLYILARLTLIVLPLMSLRSLPPGAYNSANWIRFIPHI